MINKNKKIHSNMRKKQNYHMLLYMDYTCYGQTSQTQSFKTTPDLEIVVGYSEILEEFERVLQLKNKTIELYYATTFNLDLGAFCVSTIVFRQPNVNQQTFNTCCIYDSGEKISKVPRRICRKNPKKKMFCD